MFTTLSIHIILCVIDSKRDLISQETTILFHLIHAKYKGSVAAKILKVPSTELNLFFDRRAILIAQTQNDSSVLQELETPELT